MMFQSHEMVHHGTVLVHYVKFQCCSFQFGTQPDEGLQAQLEDWFAEAVS